MQFFQDQVQYLLDVLEGCFRRLSLSRRPQMLQGRNRDEVSDAPVWEGIFLNQDLESVRLHRDPSAVGSPLCLTRLARIYARTLYS